MPIRATVKRLIDGMYQARADASPVGAVEKIARTREEALDRLRQEIEYRLELCTCSQPAEGTVTLDVRDLSPSPTNGMRRVTR